MVEDLSELHEHVGELDVELGRVVVDDVGDPPGGGQFSSVD